jgi:nucleoside-diphosphate-sugar epimerase
MVSKNFILFGANSELATTFAEEIVLSNHKVYGISRSVVPYLDEKNQIQIKNYIDYSDKLHDFIKKIDEPYLIFFNGYLAENRPKYLPNQLEIEKTIYANYLTPLNLTNKIFNNHNVKKFVYISSIAAVKPRLKNYIYGLSKKSLEESISRIHSLNYLIIRFGQIETSMSETHNTPPFTLTKKEASKKMIKLLPKKGLQYASVQLLLASILIKLLPTKLLDKIEKML